MAAGVMLYHYTTWSEIPLSSFSASVITKLGLYGVEVFFVISGFSLAYIYRGTRFDDLHNVCAFFTRRFFRIAPLFFVCALAMLALKVVLVDRLDATHAALDPIRIMLNFTFLFGIVDPAASLVVAGWSIGLEMVFYAVFPLLMLLFARPWCIPFITVLCFAIATLFERSLLDPSISLSSQWSRYVMAPNHLIFFVTGMALAWSGLAVPAALPRWLAGVTIVIASAALVIPFAHPSEIDLVTGAARVWLSVSCCVLVFCVAKYVAGPGRLRRWAVHLGDISYSVYLLHFFVYHGVTEIVLRLGLRVPTLGLLVISIAGTLVAAHCSYRVLETPLMQFAKRLTPISRMA